MVGIEDLFCIKNNEREKKISSLPNMDCKQCIEVHQIQTYSLDVKRSAPPGLRFDGGISRSQRFRRLRFLNEYPVAVEEIWLDRSCISKINKSRISDSLYKFYKDDLELLIMRTEDWVGIDSFPEWGEDIFFLAPQENCGFVERFGWSQTDQKVEYSRTWFDAGRARYVARLR